jgi:hypothetical protein
MKLKTTVFICAALLCFMLVSCPFFPAPDDLPEDSSVVTIIVLRPDPAALSFRAAVPAQAAAPPDNVLNQLEYTVTFTKVSIPVEIKTLTIDPGANQGSQSLNTGIWNVAAEACLPPSEEVVGTSNKVSVTLAPGTRVPVTLQMYSSTNTGP